MFPLTDLIWTFHGVRVRHYIYCELFLSVLSVTMLYEVNHVHIHMCICVIVQWINLSCPVFLCEDLKGYEDLGGCWQFVELVKFYRLCDVPVSQYVLLNVWVYICVLTPFVYTVLYWYFAVCYTYVYFCLGMSHHMCHICQHMYLCEFTCFMGAIYIPVIFSITIYIHYF